MKIQLVLERVISSEKSDELSFQGQGKPTPNGGTVGQNNRLRVVVTDAKLRGKFKPGKSYTFDVSET